MNSKTELRDPKNSYSDMNDVVIGTKLKCLKISPYRSKGGGEGEGRKRSQEWMQRRCKLHVGKETNFTLIWRGSPLGLSFTDFVHTWKNFSFHFEPIYGIGLPKK